MGSATGPGTTDALVKLVIVSNRLPMSLVEKERGLEFAQSPGGLASGLRTYLDSPRSAVGVGPRGRGDAPLPRGLLGPARVPHSRGHRGLLRGLLQPDALATFPLLPRARVVRRGPLGDLRTHQRSVLQRRFGRGRTGRHGLGPRLSLSVAAGDASGATASPEGRFLLAHPLPVL